MPSDQPDASRPDDPRPDDSEPGLDIDAAFAEIVAHWEPSPPSPDDERPETPVERAVFWDPFPATEDRTRPTTGQEAQPQPEDEEEHFIPPPPPPLPKVDPRRRLAWIGLFGAPALGLLLLVLGIVPPGWVEVGLVAAFVGGFGYLVATMGSSPPDPWSGDDGAVL